MKILSFFEPRNSLVEQHLIGRGHQVTSISDPEYFTIPFPYDGTVSYKGEDINVKDYDLALTFRVNTISRYVYRLLLPHIPVVGNVISRAIMRDKVSTAIVLSNAGIDVASSLYSDGYLDMIRCNSLAEDLVEKPVAKSLGEGIILHKGGLHYGVRKRIIQEYLNNSGIDERWVIVDGVVVCAELRSSDNPEEEFRSSLALGGTGTPLPITEEMQELGKRVFDCFPGCVYTGIDVIRRDGVCYISECNSSPLSAIIEITGHDFYDDICEYIESVIIDKNNV